MSYRKVLFNNSWNKNYSIKEIFFKKDNKKFFTYLKKQNYISYNLIKNNFSLNYDKNYPIGYSLEHQKKIVGFLGTLFSKRIIKNKKYLFCNIHSWLVDVNHRIASHFLFKKILKNTLITVLTPRPGLTKIFKSMGFIQKTLKYRILFLLNFSFLILKKKNIKILTDEPLILQRISKNDLKVFKDHSNNIFLKFIIINTKNNSDYAFVIAKKIKKKNLFNVLNFIYVSNSQFLKKNWNQVQKQIFTKFNILFCGQFFLKDEETALPNLFFFTKNYKKEIFLRNIPNNFNFNSLYSEYNF